MDYATAIVYPSHWRFGILSFSESVAAESSRELMAQGRLRMMRKQSFYIDSGTAIGVIGECKSESARLALCGAMDDPWRFCFLQMVASGRV